LLWVWRFSSNILEFDTFAFVLHVEGTSVHEFPVPCFLTFQILFEITSVVNGACRG
jgi:hypothetical protein